MGQRGPEKLTKDPKIRSPCRGLHGAGGFIAGKKVPNT